MTVAPCVILAWLARQFATAVRLEISGFQKLPEMTRRHSGMAEAGCGASPLALLAMTAVFPLRE
jgi:hypothetical protein